MSASTTWIYHYLIGLGTNDMIVCDVFSLELVNESLHV